MSRMPVYFLSHGGGPWPYIEGMKQQYVVTERDFRALSERLPSKPKAILVITGHWEEGEFTVSTSEKPPMIYDYYGFPEHTYKINYPAPGSPELALRVKDLLSNAGFSVQEDSARGFDHGTFVPLSLIYPDANVPVVMLSMRSSYDPQEHIRVGEALESLRDEGILIIGSGLNYHNMRGFGRDESKPIAEAFENYLHKAIDQENAKVRNDMLVNWETAPYARLAHPREDHLIPLMVVAGAAGHDIGQTVSMEYVMSVPMASYEFGGVQRGD